MRFASSFRRLVYLTHRWTGVFGCVLMALWFISGITMLFIGYPKLTPAERLAALPPLSPAHCCAPLQAQWLDAGKVILSTVGGRASYLVRPDATSTSERLDARDGLPAENDVSLIVQSARQFVPGASAHYRGLVMEDRWTHSRALDAHRPLHVVDMTDDSETRLYLSSQTGQVVLDAPLAQRRWNYVGAWLHWLYVFRQTSSGPVWHWLVIALSVIGTLCALTGILAGLWRWRFKGRYKSGSRSPYREPWMHWHHFLGLAFAGMLFAWILSGLASMNPMGIFSPKHADVNMAAFHGKGEFPALLRHPSPLLEALAHTRFRASELEWRRLGGHAYVLARDADNRTRIVVEENNHLSVMEHLPDAWLLTSAARLLPYGIARQEWLTHYDAHYYARQPEAMNGAAQRELPVWKLYFSDPGQSWIYLDPRTGDIPLATDDRKRRGRWWFNFLHSWDLPGMLAWPGSRNTILILFSLGGLGICLTSIVIAWRRLRMSFRRAPSSRKPARLLV